MQYDNESEVRERIRNFNDKIKFPKDMDPSAKSFISCCLRKVPEKRLNIHKLLKHKFIKLGRPSKIAKLEESELLNKMIKSICASAFVETPNKHSVENRDLEPNYSTSHTLSPNSLKSQKVVKYNSDIREHIREFKELQRKRKMDSVRNFDSLGSHGDSGRFVFNTEPRNEV